MSVVQSSTSGSRSRPQARKKPSDDASYLGPPLATVSTSTKRQAADKVDGEPRVKRKRVEPSSVVVPAVNRRDGFEGEQTLALVEFNKMPNTVLFRYLAQFDIVPIVHPSPMAAEDPPPPSLLENPYHSFSRAATPPSSTPANRPRREIKEPSRRRSSRLIEEDIPSRTPVLADIEELHSVLAGIVERHFREMTSITGREEVDTLASFMCAVEKAKGGKLK